MATVPPVTELNIEGEVLQVANLGPKVQALVTVYNEWNQQLADAQNRFALVQAAMNELGRQILAQIKQDAEDTTKVANEVPATPPEAVPVVTTSSTTEPTAKE